MTLNQIVQRVKMLVEGHKQVRTFKKGLVQDFLTDKTISYPAVFLQGSSGSISLGGHASTLNYRMFFLDLVHVSEDTKENEDDVQSDMLSVAMDILAQMNNGNFNDWKISSDNILQLLVEEEGDMIAGCYIDISIAFMYKQNICAVPTEIINYSTE